jgi:hypothetical protein
MTIKAKGDTGHDGLLAAFVREEQRWREAARAARPGSLSRRERNLLLRPAFPASCLLLPGKARLEAWGMEMNI